MLEYKADIILKGATFFLGRERGNNIDFVAIKGNKILKIGKEGDEKQLISNNTKIYQFDKKHLIMPGIHDNHIHLIQAGMLDKYPDLMGAKTEEEAVKIVKEYSDKTPNDKWIIGIGWSKFTFKKLPSKNSIDKYIKNRPVMLLDDELHSIWVNSKALKEAKITSKTKDPLFGKISRDENNEATGCLFENAMSLVTKIAFDFDIDLVKDFVQRYTNKALAYGITSVTDMTPFFGVDLSYPETYFTMARNNELRIRVNAALNLFGNINEILALKTKAEKDGKGMYHIPFVKQFIDGVPGNHTAMMIEDYSDSKGQKGGPLLNLEEMNKAINVAHKNGMKIRLHACGDAAVKAGLDGYENAINENEILDSRHQIEHIEVIDQNDIKRFSELGVIASVQPEHIVSGMDSFADNNYPELLGSKREKYTWPFRSLLDAGARLAGGSDCPVVDGNPFVGMYSALTRIHPDGTPEGGWNPTEKINIDELLEMYTYGAAYGEGHENELGTLEPNKLADIVVVDRNLLTIPFSEVRETKVLLTIVNGNIEYEAQYKDLNVSGKEDDDE